MKKINKKSVNLSLRILTILAFAFMFIPFNQAAAQACGDGGCNTTWGGVSYPTTPTNPYYFANPYQTPLYYNPTPTVNSNSTNPNPKVTQTKTVYVNQTPNNSTSNSTEPTTESGNIDSTNSVSGLASNEIFGSSSFLPSGLIQWILFAIFILLIIILVRRIFGAREAYEETPMKYE